MVKKLVQFQTLTGKREKTNFKLPALNVELACVEDEKMMDTLTGVSVVLISYANTKIEELEAQRQTMSKVIAPVSGNDVAKTDRVAVGVSEPLGRD